MTMLFAGNTSQASEQVINIVALILLLSSTFTVTGVWGHGFIIYPHRNLRVQGPTAQSATKTKSMPMQPNPPRPAFPQPQGDGGSNDNIICSLPPQELSNHECLAYFIKFTFNKQTGRCEEFIYGGCGGTSNLFDTVQECQQTCMSQGKKGSFYLRSRTFPV